MHEKRIPNWLIVFDVTLERHTKMNRTSWKKAVAAGLLWALCAGAAWTQDKPNILVRWPGKIAPGSYSNEIFHHMDWLPTFLAIAGKDDIKEDLLDGCRSKAMGRNYKVHLDGYNQLPLLTGQASGSPRKEVFYFSDDGDLTALLWALALPGVQAADVADSPLPSWNEGPTRQALIDFVRRVSEAGGADFVPPSERIAVFDNDATLWAERPMYFQLYFVLDRLEELAPEHPEWQEAEPFRAALGRGCLRHSAAAGGGQPSRYAL